MTPLNHELRQPSGPAGLTHSSRAPACSAPVSIPLDRTRAPEPESQTSEQIDRSITWAKRSQIREAPTVGQTGVGLTRWRAKIGARTDSSLRVSWLAAAPFRWRRPVGSGRESRPTRRARLGADTSSVPGATGAQSRNSRRQIPSHLQPASRSRCGWRTKSGPVERQVRRDGLTRLNEMGAKDDGAPARPTILLFTLKASLARPLPAGWPKAKVGRGAHPSAPLYLALYLRPLARRPGPPLARARGPAQKSVARVVCIHSGRRARRQTRGPKRSRQGPPPPRQLACRPPGRPKAPTSANQNPAPRVLRARACRLVAHRRPEATESRRPVSGQALLGPFCQMID